MDGAREFLEAVRQNQFYLGNLRAVMHIVIGRKISRVDGTVLSAGITWRQLAELFRLMRWDREGVRELGIDPDALPPRDRQRFWYTAITMTGVDSMIAREEAERLIPNLRKIGYLVE